MTQISNSPRPADFMPDIRDLLLTLWRQRILIGSIFAVLMFMGLLVVIAQPTYYKASATVLIQDSVKFSSDFTDITKGPEFTDLTIQTEVKLLTSPTVALKTIKTLELDKVPEFAGRDERTVLSQFAHNLAIAPQGSSRAIEVSFKSKSAELAAKVANAHVQSYLETQIEFKRQRVDELKKRFEIKVADLKQDVIEKSKAVSEFRAKENLVVGKDSQELIYQQITDTSAQIVPLQVHRYDLESKLKTIHTAQEAGSQDAIIDAIKSPVIQDLKVQESQIAQQVYGLSAKYGPKHPALRSAQSSLAQVRKTIANEINNIINSLQNDLDATIAQETLLNTQLETLKVTTDDLRLKLITLKSLTVEQETSQKLLDSFLTNYENIQSQASFARPDAIVASEAIAPIYPAKPGKKLLMLIVMVFASSLSIGAVFALELMKTGIRNFEDVRKLGQTPLGIIPKVDNPVQVMLSPLNSSIKESIKRIYISGLMNKGIKTVIVSSALPGEGRTTLAALMAYYLHASGHKVVLIDADFLKPDLGRLLTTPQAGYGFADVLSGRTPLSQAIRKDENGLHFIASGLRADLNPDLMHGTHVESIFSQLKSQYSFIIVDTGPVLARNEANTLATHADGVIALADWNKTGQKDITNMLSLLHTLKGNILGVVMNRVDIQKYKEGNQGTDFLLPKVEHAA